MTEAHAATPHEAHRTTRAQIVRAAAEALLEDGYADTSVRSIATRAGVAIGNLQYYFPTKAELLVEAWRDLTSRSLQELEATLNGLADPLEVLEVGVASIWDSLRRLGAVQMATFDLMLQAPRRKDLQEYVPELFARYREVIERQLDRMERSGRIRLTVDRPVLVPLVLNTVLGFALYYVVTGDDESCVLALSAFRQLAATLVEPMEPDPEVPVPQLDPTLRPHLTHLESLWDGPLGAAYRHYASVTTGPLALAAAMVETAIGIHGLEGDPARPSALLLGDLCLARASVLAANHAATRVQIGLAQAIEEATRRAASGSQVGPLRARLTEVVRT
ncbi:MAG: TetR/AcrR family transcriptional regulator [Candidatus Dormibacteraeota bacterium]|nr:TetR/AcrR family transcriptional regulator [Candidatus Dormibacteraeota bacterium]MBO0744195.1 TetR/AcrR family transcriptional regulator [Candidatus Dormibacteraeota bacterium]